MRAEVDRVVADYKAALRELMPADRAILRLEVENHLKRLGVDPGEIERLLA